jgi:hypothetical protein
MVLISRNQIGTGLKHTIQTRTETGLLVPPIAFEEENYNQGGG